MFEALDKGTIFCFLHYNEMVPRYDQFNYTMGHMNKEDVRHLDSLQLGFRFLNLYKIKPVKYERPIHWGEIKRTEFKNFLDKWGSSYNCFSLYGNDKYDDVILSIGDAAIGFVLNMKNGKLIYLPCQRNIGDKNDLQEMFLTLIDNLITYLTRTRLVIPEWADTPLFENELSIAKEIEETKVKLNELEFKLEPFKMAKNLIFSSEYNLQKELPKFLQEQFGFHIKQQEEFREDFWLVNKSGDPIAICEIKSYVKGFQKGGVYSLYNHRESYKLDESFPAILFVNAHLNASNWQVKLQPIAPQDYQVATSHNILILRVEDLIFMWHAFRLGKINKSEIESILLNNKGWLKFDKNGTYEIKE